MAALLSITNQPVATLSNQTSAVVTNRKSSSRQSEPQVSGIPYFITISNSPPALVSSNESGYMITYSRTITPGPLLWPSLIVLAASLLIVFWFSLRGRRRS